MKLQVSLAFALFAAVLLAGCVQGEEKIDGASGDGNGAGSRFEVGPIAADESALIGQVVSDSFEPLANATVVIQELRINTTTDANGRYKFEKLEPVSSVVFAQLDGFQVARASVELVAGRGAELNFILERLPGETPHIVVREQVGFLECQTGAVVLTMNCVPIQNILNDLGVNPTETKQILKWEFHPKGLEAVVAEMVWHPPIQGTAQELMLLIEQDSTDLIEGGEYGSAAGPSPVRVELLGWENIPRAPDNETLGMFQTRTFPPADPGLDHFVFQQRFTIFMSYFYYQLPTPDYSGIPDGFSP